MRQGAAFWFVLFIALVTVVVIVGGGWFLATQMGIIDLSADPDMEITMSGSPTNVTPGGNVTYTANYSNTGESPAGSVTLRVTLPPSVTVGEIVPAAACSAAGSTITCRLGTQNPDKTGSVTISGTVDSSASSGTKLQADGEIESSTTRDAKKSEAVTDNNFASATVTVQ